MSIALWTVQVALAALFALSGAFKIIVPRDKFPKKARWTQAWPAWRIKLLGFAEVAGGIGLVAPAATGIVPVLTPIAAVCLAVIMAGAFQTHRRLQEPSAPVAAIGILLLGVAVGRLL